MGDTRLGRLGATLASRGLLRSSFLRYFRLGLFGRFRRVAFARNSFRFSTLRAISNSGCGIWNWEHRPAGELSPHVSESHRHGLALKRSAVTEYAARLALESEGELDS